MNDWKQTQFGKEYDAFRQELDDYYAAYPTDVSALEQELDEKSCPRRAARARFSSICMVGAVPIMGS